MKMDFIPSILDIEASGFGAGSYPIEIGVVTFDGERQCCLIQPDSSWTHWDKNAENLHGISREVLQQHGKDIREVCEMFNELLRGTTVYCDAWSHDIRWLRTLYEYARLNCAFTLSPIEAIASEDQLLVWDESKLHILNSYERVRHRATEDAYLVQQTFVRSAELANETLLRGSSL